MTGMFTEEQVVLNNPNQPHFEDLLKTTTPFEFHATN